MDFLKRTIEGLADANATVDRAAEHITAHLTRTDRILAGHNIREAALQLHAGEDVRAAAVGKIGDSVGVALITAGRFLYVAGHRNGTIVKAVALDAITEVMDLKSMAGGHAVTLHTAAGHTTITALKPESARALTRAIA